MASASLPCGATAPIGPEAETRTRIIHVIIHSIAACQLLPHRVGRRSRHQMAAATLITSLPSDALEKVAGFIADGGDLTSWALACTTFAACVLTTPTKLPRA